MTVINSTIMKRQERKNMVLSVRDGRHREVVAVVADSGADILSAR
jgi:hypothetical protein